MEHQQTDQGPVDEIDVEAIGPPGQRRFRLLTERGEQTASLWLEKEQLQALALILDQQIARHSPQSSRADQPLLTLAARFPSRPTIEMTVGRMGVGFDERTGNFLLTAHDIEDPAAQRPSFRCLVTPGQVRALNGKLVEVINAGRPRCPLCGEPIEGKHACAKSNGHIS